MKIHTTFCLLGVVLLNLAVPIHSEAQPQGMVYLTLFMQDREEIKLVTFGQLLDDWKTKYHATPFIYNAPKSVDVPNRISTFVPSVAGGSTGIYCEITLPPAARYSKAGAPVVIHVAGGWGAEGLQVGDPNWSLPGFIEIRFNFPGGGVGSQKSGGLFDERGKNCAEALRDVARFALGKIADKNGKYLKELTRTIAPIYSNLGLCGWSNGGNATITTAGAFAKDLSGLAWIVNWESPVGDGMPNVEAGRKGNLNPVYDPNNGTWNLSALAYSDTLTVSLKTPQIKGGLYFDLNHNGRFDAADYKPDAYISLLGSVKIYYSVRLRMEAENRHLIPGTAPPAFATLAETQAFWLYRNGEYWIKEAVAGNPNLMFLAAASIEDHVQGALDHPHVLIQYEGFRTAGAQLVRLNPDRAYVEASGNALFPLAADNPAFLQFDHLSIRNALEPEMPDRIYIAAGIMELADRTQLHHLSPQLDSVLVHFEPSAIDWKPYFTLAPEEGTAFVIDTVAIVMGGGVPVLNITNDRAIILTSAGGPQLQAFEVKNNGKVYDRLPTPSRGPDGGFVYLNDGRIRFLSEEPAPGNTPQRHKSRIVSWISSDGRNWGKEPGIRYQPGAEDDSIASVPAVIQVKDEVWRMYYVGDWYRTNGIRTAISSDWGLTWKAESKANILRRGDVDPHPVYLSNGRIRLYMRSGMNKPPAEAGISYCDSDEGLAFDTLNIKLVIKDSDLPAMLKLDPAVIKFPDGSIACYIGAAPFFNQPRQPMLIVAWGNRTTDVKQENSPALPAEFQLFQNYPNPFTPVDNFVRLAGGSRPFLSNGVNPSTTIRFSLPQRAHVTLKVFDVNGREVATLVDEEKSSGIHHVTFEASNLPSGVYIYRMTAGKFQASRKLLLMR